MGKSAVCAEPIGVAITLGRGGAAIGWVTVSFDDADIVAADARQARDLGFGGKLLIHPRQVAPAQGVFQPSQEDYDWALSILEAVANSHSAVKLDGAMIDMPVIKRAERIKQDFESLA